MNGVSLSRGKACYTFDLSHERMDCIVRDLLLRRTTGEIEQEIEEPVAVEMRGHRRKCACDSLGGIMRLPNRQVVEVVCGRQEGPNVALCGSQQHPAAERRIQGQNGSTGGKHARIRVVIVRRTGDLIEEFSQALMLMAEGRFGRHVELV